MAQLFKQHKTKLVLAKISAVQVFVNFFTTLLILRQVGIGGELDIYYIGMAVFAFLYSSINWSLSSILAPYLIEHRGEHKEGRLIVSVLCITIPIAILMAVTMPLWVQLLYTNYIGEIPLSKILWVQGILIAAYVVDGFILVYTAMLQEKNRYITFNLAMLIASVLGFLFVCFTLENLGVYAAALNQLLMKSVILILMCYMFLPQIFNTIRFDKEQLKIIFHRAKYLLLGSVYFRTDEVVERFVASYLTGGFVSLLSFIQRVYGAMITVLNSAIGVPAITIFGELIVEKKYTEGKRVLLKHIQLLLIVNAVIFLGLVFLGDWFFTLLMGDAMKEELVPILHTSILCVYALVIGKTISQLLQSMLMAMNKVAISTLYESVAYTLTVGLKILLTVCYGMNGLLAAIVISLFITDGSKLYLVLKLLNKMEK